MPGANNLPDGLAPHPNQSQAQSHRPNFSRPRWGHRRNYSTELPFKYSKGDVNSSQPTGARQTTSSEYANGAPAETAAENRPRVLQTMDDGMIVNSKQRKFAEERHWAEEDVKDAFKRWDVSDKARKKLTQPRFINAHQDAQYDSEPYAKNGPVYRKVQEKGPIYEKVDGVLMDTRPGCATGSYTMEETLPEIEAHDIREIPANSAIKSIALFESEDDRRTLSSSTTASSSESTRVSPQFWSDSSGSSSSASTENSNPKPYEHKSQEFKLSNKDDREILEQAIGSQKAMFPGPSIIKGIKDEKVTGRAPQVPATSKHGHNMLPQRVLGAAGIGVDEHVYELEAGGAAAASDNRVDVNEDNAKHGNGLFGKVEYGVSKAVHALHEKVKKNVTFNPVNDVRFMTPSPHRSSMDNTSALDVDSAR